MGDKLKLLKHRQGCQETARARRQIRSSIVETLAGNSAHTAWFFGDNDGRLNKTTAEMTKNDLDVINLELAAAAVALAPPLRTEGDNEQLALEEVAADIRLTKFTLLAGKCLQQARKVGLKDERQAWESQLAKFLEGGASIAHKLANKDNAAKRSKVDTRPPPEGSGR